VTLVHTVKGAMDRITTLRTVAFSRVVFAGGGTEDMSWSLNVELWY